MNNKTFLISSALGEYVRSGEELLFFCPFCKHHKRKLSVNLLSNNFKCWVCDVRGKNIRRLLKNRLSPSHLYEWDKLHNIVDLSRLNTDLFESKKELVEEIVDLPKEFISLANKNLPVTTNFAIKYLLDRGLTKQDIILWKIGVCLSGDYSGRIIVPSFNQDGNCNYFIARAYGKEFPRYMNPNVSKDVVFNELFIDWNKDIILVEGVFDAIKAENSIPLLGSTLHEGSILFNKIVQYDPTVYIALDPDAEKKSNLIIEKLANYDIKVHKIDISGYEDVGVMTKKEFLSRKGGSKLIIDDWLLESQIKAI